MSTPAAETQYRSGLTALAEGDPATASHHFRSAIVIERQEGVAEPQMRYLSYYGLSLALAHGPSPYAIQACEIAARRQASSINLLWNLCRLYIMAGKTSKALATLEIALRVEPEHRRLRAELARLDRRGTPPLSIVPRDNPLNRWIGRARYAFRPRAQRFTGASRPASQS